MDKQEIKLIKLAQAGNERAFEDLMVLHDRSVFQVAFDILGNMQDANDVYQETFIRVFKKISSYRFESKFRTWVLRIATNLSITEYKKHKRKRWLFIDKKSVYQSGTDQYVELSDEEKPDDILVRNEQIQQIKLSLEKLTEKQRAVFVLKHMHGYKIKEIAEKLNCAEGTIKSILFRAIRKLRKDLSFYQTR